MVALRLVEMSTVEFARWRPSLMRHIAESLAGSRWISPAEAATAAEEDIGKALADGPAATGQLLRTAYAGDTLIGWIWASMPGHPVPSQAWIDEIMVAEEHRSHGYGRAILAAMEDELAGRGVDRVGLNVFGSNEIARRLYESSGYQVTQQQRVRSLSDRPQPPAAVILTPIGEASFASRMDSYEAALVTERGLAPAAAKTQAWRLLPQGRATAEIYARTVRVREREVGWVLFGLGLPGHPGTGWIHRLDIDREFRGHGYGTAVVAAVETDLAARGVQRLGAGLVSPRLYESADRHGYDLLAQQMSKGLP
jgi:GNAT superfamily N-acetyltransferase